MEDSRIVELYLARSEDAILHTQQKYGAYCHRIAKNILGIDEDAEECVNDTYHTAWNSIPPARPNNLKVWLGRVVRNTAINLYHKNRAQKRYDGTAALLSELEDCIPSAASVEREIEERELTALIERWLCTLKKDDRILFVRRYWYGVPLSELASRQKVSPNRLAQKMHRLRLSLKHALEQEGFDL